ncbi:MAG: transposase [Anaerolinea sp.]|nr:transposase [Anaerolinea sp.]
MTEKNIHHRRSIRLVGYDYASEGGYFITIVTHNRICLFGSVKDDEMRLNDFGRIVKKEWFNTAKLRPNIELLEDEFVVMPNHVHGIIWINDDFGRGSLQRTPTVEQFQKPVTNSIPTIVRLFKSTITKQINILRHTPNEPVWQRNYYEHIIYSEKDYENIANYIESNPLAWQTDKEYLEAP